MVIVYTETQLSSSVISVCLVALGSDSSEVRLFTCTRSFTNLAFIFSPWHKETYTRKHLLNFRF
jgi:hypothetical protein